MLQPVNRLPPEILSRIVQAVTLVDDTSDTLSIIVMTHVCRYWRESIISTPGNWTVISSQSKGLMALSLERSKAAPLTLSLRMSEIDDIPGFSDLIVPHIQKTKNLRVNGIFPVGEITQKLPNFPQSMPNLRSLELSRSVAEWDDPIDPFGSFPHTLRHLTLACFPLYPSLLRLRALTELVIYNYGNKLDLHLDTLLDFLEANPSLESASFRFRFTGPSLRNLRRRAAIETQLRYLFIRYWDLIDGKALMSKIALRKGAQLEIDCRDRATGFNDLLSDIPTTQFSNLLSPTSINYESTGTMIRLLGPNGSFSFGKIVSSRKPFIEFPLLPLTNIRKFHLANPPSLQGLRPVLQSSFFPALETFTVDREASISHLLSNVLSTPSSLPSLTTFGFLDCILSPDFMEALTRFASNRKNTTLALLHRVVIVHSVGKLPDVVSIDALRDHVPVVDIGMDRQLLEDLVWKGCGRCI